MNTITLKLDLYEYKQVESTCKIVAEKLGLQKDKVFFNIKKSTKYISNVEKRLNKRNV
jgi:hypothetical protein